MKKEKYIIIALVSILIVVGVFIFIRNYFSFKKEILVASNPFYTLEILDEKVRLKDEVRSYNIEVDCSTLFDENTQILYYQLKEEMRKSTVQVLSKIYKNNELIITNFKEATSIDTVISVFDEEKTYEQIYYVNATCKINENANVEEEKAEETTEENNHSIKKKTTKKTS